MLRSNSVAGAHLAERSRVEAKWSKEHALRTMSKLRKANRWSGNDLHSARSSEKASRVRAFKMLAYLPPAYSRKNP